MSEEKLTKTNGLGVDPMQRLASIKPPRDYCLGPSKPNKKVFTPNLNVTRNKNKGSSTNNVRESKKDNKSTREKRNNRNFKNGPNVVKSSGVFSEGIGSGDRHYNRSSYVKEAPDAPTPLRRPFIRVKDVAKIDKELEEQKIKMMTSCGQPADEGSEDFRRADDVEAPVRLPMDYSGWTSGKRKSMVKVKQELVVKSEPPDLDDVASMAMLADMDKKPLLDLKIESFDDADVVDLLRNETPKLMLIKFPDSLPGRGGAHEDDLPPRRKPAEEPSSSAGKKTPITTSIPNTVDSKCSLKQLEEGLIGKLQIRRSGRVTLLLGETCFEVSLGTKSAFHQEVVSVGTNAATRSAHLVSLGPLHHKLTIIPDWQDLFRARP